MSFDLFVFVPILKVGAGGGGGGAEAKAEAKEPGTVPTRLGPLKEAPNDETMRPGSQGSSTILLGTMGYYTAFLCTEYISVQAW